MEPQNLRIAISGGGLAGAALAHALCRHPHLEINIYESAPKFSERGAAIGLAINARRALARIVGQREAEEMLERAGAVKMNSARIMIVRLLYCHCRKERIRRCGRDKVCGMEANGR